MTDEANCKALQVVALFVSITLSSLISLSKNLNVLVVGSEGATCSDDAVADLLWKVTLLGERFAEVATDDGLNKWHELASKVVRCFLRHLSGQVIDTGVKDVMLFHLFINFVLEFTGDRVVKHERLLNARKVTGELDRSFEVGRDVGDSHQLALT